MTHEEIKLFRLANQRLTVPTDRLTAVRSLCGLQAQFMSNAMHALRIRCTDWADGGAGLVKSWTLRGTMHIFAECDIPLFVSGDSFRKNEWTEKTFWNKRDDWALTPQRQKLFCGLITAALEDGPAPREELRLLCRRNGMTPQEESSMFHPWGGGVREMCERGFMVYAAQEKKVFRAVPDVQPLPEDERELELLRRYYSAYGPATVRDAMYFFRIGAAKVKSLLAKLPVETASCGGDTYYYIKNEVGGPASEMPECIFLAGFDPLMLGYEKKESLFLPAERLRSIFSLAGIVSPALLLDGTVAGRWKIKGKKLLVELFEPLAEGRRERVMQAAGELWPELSAAEFTGP